MCGRTNEDYLDREEDLQQGQKVTGNSNNDKRQTRQEKEKEATIAKPDECTLIRTVVTIQTNSKEKLEK